MLHVRRGPAAWPVLGVANRITLVRAVLVGCVAVLVVISPHATTVVAIATVALILDFVDGWVARRANSVTEFGARFDMEVDAFLILALSVAAARGFGWWVLAIGFARYAFGLAALALRWLRAPIPPSRWRKFVAAVQGVTLTVAVSRVLPDAGSRLALAIALALLAHSFASQASWLWQHRASRRPAPPSTRRRVADIVLSVLSFAVVWFVLLAPAALHQLTASAFARIPIEGLVVVGLALVISDRARRRLAITTGMLLGALLVFKALDMGYDDVLDRRFNPVTDRGTFGPAVGVLSDSIGHGWAIAAVVVAAILGFAVLVLIPLSVLRVTRLAAQHRPTAARAIGVLALAWTLAAAMGLHVDSGEPVASGSAIGLTYDHVRAAGAAIEDERSFAAALRTGHDAHAAVPADRLLSKLRGKDVLVVFVESYGQVAVQHSPIAARDDALLRAGTRQLNAAGYGSRSAFLTSSTFGGLSWLAHSTLQSGLWIDSQSRYDDLVESQRFTLSDAFKKSGWRTVSDVPSDGSSWPQGKSFYHYDALYNGTNTGYLGRSFGYASIPDQYTLAKFRSLELAAPNRRPVFAEIDLVSSHTPWAPLPRMVPWRSLGDGAVYGDQIKGQPTAAEVWQHATQVRANYAQSIRYSMTALISYLKTFRDPNLVLVVLGDHQPSKTVSGNDPTHNVPISIIADDPAVLDSIDSWHWQPGLLPNPSAPIWKMDAFRDRFLDAYSAAATASSAAGRH